MPLSGNPTHADTAGLFVYRQRFRLPGRSQGSTRIGIMGVLDLRSTRILPHEETIAQQVTAVRRGLADRLHDPGPLWLWCNDPDDSLAIAIQPKGTPKIVVQDRIGCVHEYWSINASRRVEGVQVALNGRPLFLADGHHRYEAGWNFGVIQIRNHALCSLASHRLLASPIDLKNIPELKPIGDIEDYLAAPPGGKRHFVVCVPDSPPLGFEVEDGMSAGKWLRAGTPTRELRSAIDAVRCRKASGALLVSVPSVTQIEEDAFNGRLLPPKSTDFFPKLAAGIVLHSDQ
jgi:uncharacterized protein (DUF1015 family)